MSFDPRLIWDATEKHKIADIPSIKAVQREIPEAKYELIEGYRLSGSYLLLLQSLGAGSPTQLFLKKARKSPLDLLVPKVWKRV